MNTERVEKLATEAVNRVVTIVGDKLVASIHTILLNDLVNAKKEAADGKRA